MLAVSALIVSTACSPPTPVLVPTLAVLPTETDTPTPTLTHTPSSTMPVSPTPTFTPSETLTLTTTAGPTLTETPTATPTETPTLTLTPTITFTPSLTITDTITPSPTPSLTPTPNLGAFSGLLALAAQATILPPEQRYPPPTLTAIYLAQAQILARTPGAALQTATASAGLPTAVASINCPYPPPPGLSALLAAEPLFLTALGCPLGAPPVTSTLPAAYQLFERGTMIYVQTTPKTIYVLMSDGRFRRFDDTWVEGVDPVVGFETPPPGLIEPIRGFGKVWRENPDVRAALGYAVAGEVGDTATILEFTHGRAIYLPGRTVTYVLLDEAPIGLPPQGGTWRAYTGAF